MPRLTDEGREEFSSRARSPFISKATTSWFLETATPGQLAACSGMLAREPGSRERSKRARLLRQARFPVPKAVEGFDWSNARFPEGWGREEMLSPGFVGRVIPSTYFSPIAQKNRRRSRKRTFASFANGLPPLPATPPPSSRAAGPSAGRTCR